MLHEALYYSVLLIQCVSVAWRELRLRSGSSAAVFVSFINSLVVGIARLGNIFVTTGPVD